MHGILWIFIAGILQDCCSQPYCPSPTPVENAHLEPPGLWEDGDIVEYICDEGYTQAGDGRAKCIIKDNDWKRLGDGPFPPDNCTIDYITCPSPGDVPFSEISPAGNWSDKDTATYTCYPEYKMIGTASALCDIPTDHLTAGWKTLPVGGDFPPECKFLYTNCPSPGNITNGIIVLPEYWVHGDNIRYQCDSTYVMVGLDSAKCSIPADQYSYEWITSPVNASDFPPECVIGFDFCLSPGDIGNGSISASTPEPWAPTDDMKYQCDSQYVLIGTDQAECYIPYNKSWYEWRTIPDNLTDFPPECKYRYDDCPSPGNITNGTIMSPEYWTDGDAMQYECDDPYVMVGVDSAKCSIAADKSFYEWITSPVNASDFPPQCVIGFDFCLSPGDIGNGSISASTPEPWAPTDDMKYQCDSQYVLIGTDQAECYIPYNKSWYEWRTTPDNFTDFPPECKYRYDFCPSPGELLGNGSMNTTGPWTDNDILRYTCDVNFAMFGVSQGECDISDNLTAYQWKINSTNSTDFPPTCKLAICDDPPMIPHGEVRHGRPLQFNRTHVVFVCQPGFRIRGPRYATCRIELDLTWVWEPEQSIGKKWFPYPPECYIHIPHPIHYIANNQHTGVSRGLFEFLMVASLLILPVLVWFIGLVSWWLYRFSSDGGPTVIRRLPWSQGRQNRIVHVKVPNDFPEQAPLVMPKSPSPLPVTPVQPSPTPSMSSMSHSPSPSPLEETPRNSPPNISPSPTWSIFSPSPPPSPTPPPPYDLTPPTVPRRPKATKPRPLNIPNHPKWMPHANPIRNDMYHLQSSTK